MITREIEILAHKNLADRTPGKLVGVLDVTFRVNRFRILLLPLERELRETFRETGLLDETRGLGLDDGFFGQLQGFGLEEIHFAGFASFAVFEDIGQREAALVFPCERFRQFGSFPGLGRGDCLGLYFRHSLCCYVCCLDGSDLYDGELSDAAAAGGW